MLAGFNGCEGFGPAKGLGTVPKKCGQKLQKFRREWPFWLFLATDQLWINKIRTNQIINKENMSSFLFSYFPYDQATLFHVHNFSFDQLFCQFDQLFGNLNYWGGGSQPPSSPNCHVPAYPIPKKTSSNIFFFVLVNITIINVLFVLPIIVKHCPTLFHKTFKKFFLKQLIVLTQLKKKRNSEDKNHGKKS